MSLSSVLSCGLSGGLSGLSRGGGVRGAWSPADLGPLWHFTPAGVTGSGSGYTRTVASWADDHGNTMTPPATAPRLWESRLLPGVEVFSTNVSNQYLSLTKSYTSRGFSLFWLMRRRVQWSASTGEPSAGVSYMASIRGSSNVEPFTGRWGTPGAYKLVLVGGGNPASNSSIGVSNTFDLIGFTADGSGVLTAYENGRTGVTFPSAVGEVSPTAFWLGRSSSGMESIEVHSCLAVQRAIAAEEVARLYTYWRALVGAEPYTLSLTLTGDSILAGETYVAPNTTLYVNRTICERLALLHPSWRVADFTRSSTFIADGVAWMAEITATTNNRGGNAIHNSGYADNVHVICHGRNDFHRGDSLATVQASITAAISDQTALGRDVWVATLIDTVHSTATAEYPDQASFDAAVLTYNQWLRDNYVSLGCTGVVDFAANSAWTPGTTAYTNTTYYSGDNVHPNGTTGADLLASILSAAIGAVY